MTRYQPSAAFCLFVCLFFTWLVFAGISKLGINPTIDHFHYDVTHTKVSGSCSKDCAQGGSIAGKFKIIHKNTRNAMAAE